MLQANVQARLLLIHPQALSAGVYYASGKKWFDLAGVEQGARGVKSSLDAARRSARKIFRPVNGRDVFFWVPEFDAVVQVAYSRAIKAPAQAASHENLLRLVEDSINQYRATHDVHTGLRNRVAFDDHLLKCLQTIASSNLLGVTELERASLGLGRPSVILASLDIDHFKAINDRFGHGYGDLVLAALANRIEQTATTLASESDGKFSADVFRLGGEEFQIVFSGVLSEQEGVELSERVAESIRGDLLPSAGEYNALIKLDFADGTALPHDADRRVTVSIGVAAALLSQSAPPEAAKRLKRQGDLALYSAKIGGRDRVRYFDDILNRGGRISSVDAINGVIAIDIGREVGVKKGQEFAVYPPGYDGESPFFVGEGRSRKRVGNLPKYRTAIISAFDVQGGVSFCRVTNLATGVSQLQEGSTLEAIPLGSIAHWMAEVQGSARFISEGDLRAALIEKDETDSYVVLAVGIGNLEQISDVDGMDQAHEALGRVGQHMIRTLGGRGTLGQVTQSVFCAIVPCQDEEAAGELAESLRLHDGLRAGNVELGVGWVYKPSDAAPAELSDANDASCYLDAALFAAIEAARNNEVQQFTLLGWSASLARSRAAGQYNRMIADYKLFTDLGLSISFADNQMAFLYIRGPEKNLVAAEAHLRRACSLEDVPSVVKQNLGCLLIWQERAVEGLPIVLAEEPHILDSYCPALFYGALRTMSADEFRQFVADRMDLAKKVSRDTAGWLNRSQLDVARNAVTSVLAELQ
ncbi:hypothetical protein PAGU2638_12840 [Lysobacter sp. PAGU 2638]